MRITYPRLRLRRIVIPVLLNLVLDLSPNTTWWIGVDVLRKIICITLRLLLASHIIARALSSGTSPFVPTYSLCAWNAKRTSRP